MAIEVMYDRKLGQSVLFHNGTGEAFGPTFFLSREELGSFLRWMEQDKKIDPSKRSTDEILNLYEEYEQSV